MVSTSFEKSERANQGFSILKIILTFLIVHQLLNGHFGVDLTDRRDFISKSIDEIIHNNLTT